MSTEQEISRMASDLWEKFESAHGVLDTPSSWRSVALMAIERGATLPPAPQWKPGQVVWLTYLGARHLAERGDGGWWIVGYGPMVDDDQVTDVEPVAVLTAEDMGELVSLVMPYTNLANEDIREFFAERGVDVR